MTTDADDIRASLMRMADRDDLEAVVVIAITKAGQRQVFGFGPSLEDGKAVDDHLVHSRVIIRAYKWKHESEEPRGGDGRHD